MIGPEPSSPLLSLSQPVGDAALRALPPSTLRRVQVALDRGRVATLGDLFAMLTARQAERVREALCAEDGPPGVHDLRAAGVNDLLRSVGMPLDPLHGWYTVGSLISGSAPATEALRDRLRGALAIRAERRERAWRNERERHVARATQPERALVPLWKSLHAESRQARPFVVPEGECDALVEWRIDGAQGSVTLSGEQAVSVAVGIVDGLVIDTTGGPRWRLAAVDRLLDAIAQPGDALHAELVRVLSLPPWERGLERLDSWLGAVSAPADPLGWRVKREAFGALSIRPVTCAPKSRGGWSVKALRWEAITTPMVAEPADERLIDLLSGWRRDVPSEIVAVAAEALIGHPRVFSGSKGAHPLSIRRRTLCLALDGDHGTVEPRVEVDGVPVDLDELTDFVHAGGGVTWLRLVDGAGVDELQLVPVRRAARAVLSGWLSRREELPAEALEPLVERLSALTSVVPVRVSGALRGAALAPDDRPVVRVRWDGATLDLEVRVRPIPELAACEPGAGLAELVTVRDGEPFHVVRDLAAESARVEAALARLGLPDADRAGWRWTIAGRERALHVVSAIAEAGGAFQTAWEGPPPSVHRVRGKALKVRVTSGRGWFDIEGGLQVEGARVPLEAVLEAVREGSTFVQVRPGVFARLADELRASLAPVAASDDEGRLSALHAPALEALAEADVEVEADEPFRASLDRLRASAALEVAVPDGLRAELRPYQAEGFRWLARLATWASGAVLADDMGLGKTVQAIALLCRRAGEGPALVVSPLSVASNWVVELGRFAPGLRVVRYRGPGRAALLQGLGPSDVVLTTWDLLARDAELAEVAWTTTVLDEAQAIKNAATARAKGAARLRSGIVVALTGTPVENRTEELWSLLRVVAPGLLGGEARFGKRFAGPIAAQVQGAREALARVVRPFVLRRTKAEVAPELPERTEVVVRVPLSADERALYERARLEAVLRTTEARGGRKRFEAFRWLTHLRQLACHPKLVDVGSPIPSSKLETFRRRVADLRATGHRALVFSQFVRHLELAREALLADGVSCRWLTGDSSEREREREVAAFQRGEGDVFLISLGAGGTGLNLTAATYVFHLDPWWNPAKEDQASDRAHRIGQTQPVTVYRIVAEGTIEERILDLHAEKRQLADALLAGADGAARVSSDELVALLAEAGPIEAPAPPEAPSAPAASTASEPADPAEHPWRERFRRHLDEDLAAGRLKTSKVADHYVCAMDRMLAWAGGPTETAAVADAARRWLDEVRAKRIGTGTDRVFGRPAMRRLLAMLEA